MSSIALIIPTMNRPNTLKRTLETVLKGSRQPEKIIVVDQSTKSEEAKGTKELIEEISKEIDIQYIFLDVPSSTRARNIGIESVSQDIVVFSDDDVDLCEDTLFNLEREFEDNGVALVAGVDLESSKSGSNIGYLLGTRSYKKREIGHVTSSLLGHYPEQVEKTVETEWAMGYFFAVRKKLIDEWNIRFDENLTGYAFNEDLDFSYRYCRRAKQLGMTCILSSKVRVKHLVSKEYRVPSRMNTYMYVFHRMYFAKKIGKRTAGIIWCDFWRLIERTLHKQSPQDLVAAYRVYYKNKKSINAGDIGRFLP